MIYVMRFNYTLYSEAQEKLEKSGLLNRIKEIKRSKDGLPYVGGSTKKEDIVQIVTEMRQEGFFKTLPEPGRKDFQQALNSAFEDFDKNPWKVERDKGVITCPAEPEDYYLMTGWLASMILKKDKIWDYQRFGFSSINDFIGSFGVAIWNEIHTSLKTGYQWVSSHDNRLFENNITGDMNLDLRIYRTDITPDKTFDPTGTQVSYRPELDEDRTAVCAYHSTESSLFVGLLKYVEQLNLNSSMLENKAQELINYTKSLGHTIGSAAECFGIGDGIGESPRILLSHFMYPLPKLNENLTTEEPCFYQLCMQSNNSYGMYIGPNNELMFVNNQKNLQKKSSLTFCPEEVDNLLKGVCYQCAKGLGRTVPKIPLSILEYKYSPQFEKDQAELKSF